MLENVPASIPLTVTVTKAKGIDTTLDLAERPLRQGHAVSPHLPGRQFADETHVADVVARLREAQVRSPRPSVVAAFALVMALRGRVGKTAHLISA